MCSSCDNDKMRYVEAMAGSIKKKNGVVTHHVYRAITTCSNCGTRREEFVERRVKEE